MSDFAEKIKRHYAGLELGAIEVPEWGLTIHVRPATIRQSAEILAESDQFRQTCKMIQVRSKREDGSPMFDAQDFAAMVDYGEVGVINRVVDQIMAVGDLEEGEAKKQ